MMPELKEALNITRRNCSKELYGECLTIACMRKDADGHFVKPYEFIGCVELRVFNAYLDAEARARKAEFERHHHGGRLIVVQGKPFRMHCDDPCHKWTFADWREAVVKELEEHA